jgi:hypothetical protein
MEGAQEGFKSDYSGCAGIPSGGVELLTEISPEAFFDKFAKTRTPVAFNYLLDAKCSDWSDAYLRERCGECEVKVERRTGPDDRFGKGNETRMKFGEFMDTLESGSLYLTTQELEYDADDRPSLVSAPLTRLVGDYPLPPSLTPNLIVSNVNMWFGYTKSRTTSGLHHDFHDNLYLLLRGEKEVTLYSPAEAHNLYTVGEIAHIHPNGRINYKDQPTHPDGSDLNAENAAAAAARVKAVAARMLAWQQGQEAPGQGQGLGQVQGQGLGQGQGQGQGQADEEDEDALEDEMDAALDAVLDAEMDRAEGSEGSEDSDEDEDDEDSDGDEDEDDDDADPDDDASASKGDADNKEKDSDAIRDQPPRIHKRKLDQLNTTNTKPQNFSQVDTSLPDTDKQLYKNFPKYVTARGRGVKVLLRAGQMLYIPAGWFHEVRSKGDSTQSTHSIQSSSSSSGSEGVSSEGVSGVGHLALNYWFHPPDGANFAHPYTSDFWAKEYAERQEA